MRNLITQFPDDTKKTQEKYIIKPQHYPDEFKVIAKFPDDTKKARVKPKMYSYSYDDMFKKWHSMLLLILIGCCVMIYVLVAYAPELYRWILPDALLDVLSYKTAASFTLKSIGSTLAGNSLV